MKKIIIEDLSIFYERTENKKSDTLYVFLHGWGGSKKSFKALSKIIQTKGQDTLIFDFPGFGDSDNPPFPWNTHDYAKNFAKFLMTQKNISNKKIVLYGHSFGCRVLVRYLTELSFEKNISEIFLTGAAGIVLPLPWHKQIIKKLSKISQPIKKFIPTNVQSFIRRKILKAHDWDAVSGVMKQTFSQVIAEPDFRDELKKINIPTTLIWGAKDSYTPLVAGKIFEAYLPNVKKFHIIPEGKHGIHHTHTELIANIIAPA